MKIGDFSKLTKVSVRMLRYYDKENVLTPQEIDRKTGHRSYSISQVPMLQKIIMLRDLNFSISEIKEITTNWDKNMLLNSMEKQLNATYQLIEDEQNRAKKLHKAIEYIEKNEIDKHYTVLIKSVPAFPLISLRRKMKDYFEEEILWIELNNFVIKYHIPIDQTRYNNIAIYHDSDDNNIDIEVAYIVKKEPVTLGDIKFRTLEEVPQMASMMVYGSYKNIAEAYRSFVNWLSKNSEYSIGNTSRQITIVDRRHTSNEEEYLTEIQIPLSVIKMK